MCLSENMLSGAKKTRAPGMFARGAIGVRLGLVKDSTTEHLAQGKQARCLLYFLVRKLVSLVFFWSTASAH